MDILINHLGYMQNQPKYVIAASGDSFVVTNEKNETVYEGKLEKCGDDLGSYVVGDFSDFNLEGRYRIVVEKTSTRWFDIGASALKNYQDALYKSAYNWFKKERCGNTTEGWMGVPCHLDDGRRSDNSQCQDFSGGWHDASDRRKFVINHTLGLLALLDLKSAQNPQWDKDVHLFKEIKWGNTFLLKMQDPSGFLYSFTKPWPNEEVNRLTDNITCSADERIVLVDRNSLAVHFNFIAVQAKIYRFYGSIDGEYTARCIDAARQCFEYCKSNYTEMSCNVEENDPHYKYLNPNSDMVGSTFRNLGSGILAGLELYKATENEEYRIFALGMVDELLSLQESDYIENQKQVKGFFYKDSSHSGIQKIKVSESIAFIALCDLFEEFPFHPTADKWKKALTMFFDGYLLPISYRNAFGILPYGLWVGSFNNEARNVGNLYYRYFKGQPEYKFFSGRNDTLLGLAASLAKASRLFSKPEYNRLAWRQLDWLLGVNPFEMTMITGAGHHQAPFYAGQSRLIPIDGGVMNGITGDLNDYPVKPEGNFEDGEYWIPNVSYFIMVLSELLGT